LSIPNLITLGRILLVPIVVWAIASGAMEVAFILFLAAGISDALDGYLAKRFGVSLLIPGWLVILVVSRDIMIVGAVMLSWLIESPIKVKPLLISKLNTVAQIVFACVRLGSLSFNIDVPLVDSILMGCVAILTLLSISAYVVGWIRHMNSAATGA
jgi:cardiolipin synthase